jgi:predicted GNAT family acetyltransferase
MEIQLNEEGFKGAATAQENGETIGTMTYSKAGKEMIIIDSTHVESGYSGQGVGVKMLYKIVDMARENNIKIIPLCPFSAAMFKNLSDIRDVLK